MESQLKSEILKILLSYDKLSTRELIQNIKDYSPDKKMKYLWAITQLQEKGYIKRLHKRWHKPQQEYSLTPYARKYLENKRKWAQAGLD